MSKISVKNLDLYYGDFKALKNSHFSHVVTNKNNRFRLEKEQEERFMRILKQGMQKTNNKK